MTGKAKLSHMASSIAVYIVGKFGFHLVWGWGGGGSVKRSVSRLPTMQHLPRKHHGPLFVRFAWKWITLLDTFQRRCYPCSLLTYSTTNLWCWRETDGDTLTIPWWCLKQNANTVKVITAPQYFMWFWCVMLKGILGVCASLGCVVKHEPRRRFFLTNTLLHPVCTYKSVHF